jgi:hypothetical protein
MWQRVRESNPCTSLERAYAFPRVRFAVATLLQVFNRLFRLLRIALYASWSSGLANESRQQTMAKQSLTFYGIRSQK